MKKGRYPYRASLVAAIALLFTAIAVNAATITVVSTADAGGTCPGSDCTLRQAIATVAAGDAINFSFLGNATITLASELVISKSLTISGPGATKLTVQRSTAAGTPTFRIFNNAGNFNVTFSGMTIANGSQNFVNGAGGGIYNDMGSVTLIDSVMVNNIATEGGAIRNGTGTVTLIRSTLSSNRATAAGGIDNGQKGVVAATDSTFSGNQATSGGAIYSEVGVTILTNCMFTANRGTNAGAVEINGGTATITNSTFSGNTGSQGGALSLSGGTATLTSCTIANNQAANGSGGGIINNFGTLNLRNTIVALNTTTMSGPDIFGNTSPTIGSTTSKGFNLIGNNKDANITATTGDQFGSPAAPIDPLLGPLQDNGGPTQTRALLAGSKAIDKGDSSGSSTDQRGFTRPVVSPITHPGDGSDIGAFEVQPDQLAGCSEINLVVNNNADAGAGSLRSVIGNACPGSAITFASNVRGSITLTSGELVINKGLTIKGPGADLLRVERSAAAGTASFRVFTISGSFNAAISGLTIANGISTASGGGINSSATLRLSNVTVTGNKAQNGGGIFNSGTMTLIGATLSANSVSSTTIAGSGGAIFNFGAPLTLINSTVSGNSAVGPGGNSDSGGGIFSNVGTVSLISSTITGNSGDIGGGVRVANGGTFNARNTIIALNNSPSGPDVNGPLTSQGFNLIGNSSGASITPSPNLPDQVGVTAAELNLGPLQYNGGPTQTHALLTNSRAIDKGHSSSTTTDQRGLVRPLDLSSVPNAASGDGADVGAFESGSSFYPVTLANISTRLRVETGDNALIAGFIVTGTQDKKVIIRGIGPSLGLTDQLANPTLELYNGGTLLKSNDDWQNSIPADKQAILDSTIPPSNDLESAIVATLPANGTGYTAVLRGANSGTGIGVIQVYDLDGTVDSKLANISTRGFVSTGDNVLFAGMIVLGQGSQKVIIRALGPSVPVPGNMADPTLELHDGNGGLLDANDNWKDSPNKQAIIDSLIPPTSDSESAIAAILPGGGANYTAIVRGANNTTGIAVVEVYALP